MIKPMLSGLCALFVTGSLWSASAPCFSLKQTDGKTFKLADHVGKQVIVIDFWATWCKPCTSALKHVQALKTKHPDVLVLAASIDDTRTVGQVGPYVQSKGYTFTTLLDTDSNVCRSFNPSGSVPFTVVIDKKGEVVYTHSGYAPGDETQLFAKVEAAKK